MTKQRENEVVYFNNRRNREHTIEYGDDAAFFDLNLVGRQAKMAVGLPVGQECVVVRQNNDDRLQFDWYALTGEDIKKDSTGKKGRVFYGEVIATETMTKGQATRSAAYKPFFNINGHFKRQSVVLGATKHKVRPSAGKNKVNLLADEVNVSDGPFIEGATRQIVVNSYERSASARKACINKYGTACAVCEFSFGEVYGEEMNGLIHVHHLRPISTLKKSYRIKVDDLRPVCPNCHAAIHFRGGNRSIEEVQHLMSSSK